MNLNRSPFTCSYEEGGGGNLNNFRFAIFTGRFPSDDAASMGVKGLIFKTTLKQQLNGENR